MNRGLPNLRILMVAPQPFFRARGTPFSVLHRIRALCKTGYHVDLVTYPFGEDVSIDGLRIIRCGKPPLVNDVAIGPSVAKLLLDVPLYFRTRSLLRAGGYDLLHSHEEAAFFCVGLAARYGLPHIYDMHSSLPQQLETFGSYDVAPVRKVFEYLERHVLTTCDGVITICPDLADRALPLCQSVPHAMIENTADDREAFRGQRRDFRDELGLADKKVILYTGTFESYQGLDMLLEAMQILVQQRPDVHLLMVGGREEQISAYQDIAGQRGITDHLTFTGTVSPSLIPSYQDAANIIASPRSSGTNSPLKIYGYMRSERPIVATNLFTHTQVLDDSVALLVPPAAADMAAGIRRLIEEPELGATLAATARQRAERDFSDAAYIEKVAGLYEQVLQRSFDSPTPATAR